MCRDLGYRVDDLDPAQVREFVPLAGDNVVGGIHLRGFGGQANPQRTVQAYAWALQDLGGRILQHTPATRILAAGGRVTGVETPRGIFACDHLVVAAGPQAEALLAPLGVRLPLAPARAEMIVTEPAPLMPVGGRRRQWPLRTPDPARQPRLRRRPARVAGGGEPTAPRGGPRRPCCATSPAGWPNSCPGPPTCG